VASTASIDEHAFAREFGVPLTRVGTVVTRAGDAPTVRFRAHGAFVDLPPGHDHFSK
jgi:hypothetical protein